MEKIIKLSENGFKTDSNKWYTCDKLKVVSKPLFKSLTVGSFVSDITFKGKYVIGFKILNHKVQGFEGESTNSPSLNIDKKLSCDSPSLDIKPVKNGLMYGQCVNLAFNHISNNECGLNINNAFDLADKIYNEYVKRA